MNKDNTRLCGDLQLLEAEATEPLEIADEDEEVRDEGIELEGVTDTTVRVEEGVGVGETADSSSVEMTDVRVELAITVDCADACAI